MLRLIEATDSADRYVVEMLAQDGAVFRFQVTVTESGGAPEGDHPFAGDATWDGDAESVRIVFRAVQVFHQARTYGR